jgi:hypothetical protein
MAIKSNKLTLANSKRAIKETTSSLRSVTTKLQIVKVKVAKFTKLVLKQRNIIMMAGKSNPVKADLAKAIAKKFAFKLKIVQAHMKKFNNVIQKKKKIIKAHKMKVNLDQILIITIVKKYKYSKI